MQVCCGVASAGTMQAVEMKKRRGSSAPAMREVAKKKVIPSKKEVPVTSGTPGTHDGVPDNTIILTYRPASTSVVTGAVNRPTDLRPASMS